MTWYKLSEFGTTVLEVLQDDFELYEFEDQLIVYSDGLHAPIATKHIKRFVRGRMVGGHWVSGHYKSSSRQSTHWVDSYRRGGWWREEHWVDEISDTYVPHVNFSAGVGPEPSEFVDKSQFAEIIGRIVLGTCD